MDIQLASNFERLIYDLYDYSDEKTIKAMRDIKENGKYSIIKENLKKVNTNFLSSSIDENEILNIIKNVYTEFDMILDPHTACLLYTSPSPRDPHLSRMPSSA